MCPTYVFTTPSGRSTEITCPMGQAPQSVEIDGEIAERDLVAEQGGINRPAGTWPMASDALAVHPVQIKEAWTDAKKKGVETDFTKDGRPIFTSPGHRKRYCETYGYFDKNGGYSDPTPRKRD